MSELLSYTNILNDIQNFKRSGTAHGQEFNIYDTPAHKYFKILFYFGSDSEFGDGNGSSGLLAPTWELFGGAGGGGGDLLNMFKDDLDTTFNKADILSDQPTDYYNYNSAWAFLKMNDENERAEKLEQFVTLLSDISANSPWYFSKLSGISDAINRKSAEEGKIDVSEDRKLTITCLPDAFDNRIGTLLELYRDVVWSWIQKKEIVPANLRKFDMAVYIFETPEMNWHKVKKDALGGLLSSAKDTIIDNDNVSNNSLTVSSNDFKPSYKMLEFHDCEFNYNSSKSAWSDIDNTVGIAPTYTIEISYKDCYEVSYNDIMMRTIGDVILTDMPRTSDAYESHAQTDSNAQAKLIKDKTYPYKSNFLVNMGEQLGSVVVHDVKNIVKKGILGNIYGYSLTNVVNYGKDVLNGNIIQVLQKSGVDINGAATKGGQSVKDWVKRNLYASQKKQTTSNKPSGNIFNSSTIANN